MSAVEEKLEASGLGFAAQKAATVSSFIRIFAYASPRDRCLVVASCIAAFGSGLTMPFMYILFGRLTGDFTGFFEQGSQESEDQFLKIVNQTVQQIALVFVAKLILTYAANLGLRITSLRISATVRTVYLRSLFSLPISTLDMLPTGQTAAIITTVANNLQLGISEKLGDIFSGASMIIGSLAVAVSCDWMLTLVASLGFISIAVIYTTVTPRISGVVAAVMERDIYASTVAAECFHPGAARILAAFGAGEKLVARYAAVVEEGRQKGEGMARLVATQNGLIHFAIYATFAVAFWTAFQMYMLLEITSPEPLIVVLLSTIQMASSLGQMSTPIAAAFQAVEAMAVFNTIIFFPKSVQSTNKNVSSRGEIVLQNVNFIYPGRADVKVLDDLSLVFPAGKVTAIVGPSGSGKSTIVAIIQRWYEFDGDPITNPLTLWCRNGLVAVSGTKLSDIDPTWWRSQIGLVQQDNVLFNTSIYKNVEFGLVGTSWEHAPDAVKEQLIRNACKDAFADEFISRLPEGYSTTVGQTGLKLSGGQRQRLAIARAIVKQPSILILDEATSAIDVRSEQMVQAALDRASQGRTTIVIAHRLSTIKKADKIVVLRKGQVVQQGTHVSLMTETEGVYARLVSAQRLNTRVAEELDVLNEKMDLAAPSLAENQEMSEKTEHWAQTDEQSSELTQKVDEEDEADILEGRVQVIGQPSIPLPGFWSKCRAILCEQSSYSKTYLAMVLGALATGSSTPFQAFLFAILISLFSTWDAVLFPATVNFWVFMMTLLALAVGAGHAALGWSTTTLGFAISRTYRKEYFSNILHKPATFFDNDKENSVGALTSRLASDPMQLQDLVGIHMASLATSSTTLLGCIAVSLVFGWKLTLVALATTLPVILFAVIYRMRYEMELDKLSAAVFAESARFAAESIAAMRTVVSLTMEEDICRRYEELLLKHTYEATSFRHGKAAMSVLLFAVSDSVSLLCMAFVLWYGAQLLGDGEYTPFQYMVVYIAVLQGGMSAGEWLSLSPNISNAVLAVDRMLAARESGDDEQDDGQMEKVVFDGDRGILESMVAGSEDDTNAGVEIEFRDVSFQYPTRPVQVLDGFNLKIEKGSFVALVGPSGSGKSTVISLIENFYTPQRGHILVNGAEIAGLDLEAYRRGISLVSQEPNLFSGTIRENITLGLGHEHDDDTISAMQEEENIIHQAARNAGIHDFIVSLPLGYDTTIGAGGLALSGGQKQRISLARALARQTGLLLLDEATSSLDSETEARVQAALAATRRGSGSGTATRSGRTMVVVAHRLATVRDADVIYVLGDNNSSNGHGNIIEHGTHATLLARRGIYYSMVS
ncbi:ABC transporter [Coniella lustricola]|uniref:ABC transporter n=1 Tax=Coniella lustricola TaxID=2025994 RepID=A0A2T2ZZJ0_9PEZI|nr:ABC transporter [Coniella lustricola]